VQSQGTKREPTQDNGSADKGQLERSAGMFEMILQTAPDAVENYLALKDIYRQLNRIGDFKRITNGLAEVYLGSNQRERAAKEYGEVLEIDPNDAEALGKLQEMGYAAADLPSLKAQSELQDLRERYEQKAQDLQKAEEAFLKASAKARDARRGEDEETNNVLQDIEKRAEKELKQLVAEHERWLTDGRTEVFNEVAESLKEKADRIIRADECKDIRKSIKKAERLLASTDRVFEEFFARIWEEREREFPQKTEEVKQRHERGLHAAWQEAVSDAEGEESAADMRLRKIKEEVRELEGEVKEFSRKGAKVAKGKELESADNSEVVVVAPTGLQSVDEASGGASRTEATREPTTRDEVGKALGAILVQHGLVSREHVEEAIAKQGDDHRPIGEILVQCGYATEEDIVNALVAQAGVPYLPLANYEIGDDVAETIPPKLARRYAVMPADRIGRSCLLVAMGIPLNDEQKKEVQRHVGPMKIKYFISSWSDIKAKHEEHYGLT